MESSSHHTSLHAFIFSSFSFLSAALTTKACFNKASKHRRDPWIQDQTSSYWAARNIPPAELLNTELHQRGKRGEAESTTLPLRHGGGRAGGAPGITAAGLRNALLAGISLGVVK